MGPFGKKAPGKTGPKSPADIAKSGLFAKLLEKKKGQLLAKLRPGKTGPAPKNVSVRGVTLAELPLPKSPSPRPTLSAMLEKNPPRAEEV